MIDESPEAISAAKLHEATLRGDLFRDVIKQLRDEVSSLRDERNKIRATILGTQAEWRTLAFLLDTPNGWDPDDLMRLNRTSARALRQCAEDLEKALDKEQQTPLREVEST